MTIRRLGPQEEFEGWLSLDSPSFSHTFQTIGTFEYYSQSIPWMKGEVVVREYRAPPVVYNLDFVKPTLIPKPIEEKEIILDSLIPKWIKNSAQWWGEGEISDSEFISSIEFLIKNKIIDIQTDYVTNSVSTNIPSWIKKNALWWSFDLISDSEFLSGIKYLIENGIIKIPQEKVVADIVIQADNPSTETWKKFVRTNQGFDWNSITATWDDSIANPTYTAEDGVIHAYYDIYVSDIPTGSLPIDYRKILNDSFNQWEQLNPNLHFRESTRIEANILVAWTIEDLPDKVVGHAHIGKGAMEVEIGDKNCNGWFELYSEETVQNIMMHEIGHSIGLTHVDDPQDLMYPKLAWLDYKFCNLE